jgi:Mg-chelatase subunit ChlD
MSVWVFVGVYFYLDARVEPTCFDGIQNGEEAGVDCNGWCVRMCSFSVMPPKVQWVESFRIMDGQYNAVAYIENPNTLAATKELRYTLKLLEAGSVIAERSGTTILPPNSTYPIFEGRILTDNGREPTETIIELEPVEVWQPATADRSQFRVVSRSLLSADERPRLTAEVENTALTNADAVEVVTTIFSREGAPLTASRTYVDDFLARTTREIIFTWPNPISTTVRSCEIPNDIMLVLDRSGSMAADQAEPPEPLTSAKTAAQNFVSQVTAGSRVGFLSYATTPATPIDQQLTDTIADVRSAIARVEMGEDGIQYTNMGDAFKVAHEELTSVRHRDDARKVMVFMTDGDVTRPINPETGELDRAYAAEYARAEAEKAKDEGTIVYAISFGAAVEEEDGSLARDTALIRDLASGPEYYYEAPTIADLERVYREIATGICDDEPTRIDVIAKTDANFTPLR